MSDFIDEGYEQMLRVAGNRHDLIGLKIYDKMEQVLPNIGLVRVEDEETVEEKWVDTSSKKIRQEYEKEFFANTDHTIAAFKKAGSDLLHVRTDDDYVKILRRFFISRNR
mgnify:CR=1 FL=1